MGGPTANQAEIDATTVALRQVVLAANRFRASMAREQGLGIRDTSVLAHLIEAGGQLTPRELSGLLMVSSGTLSAVLRRLEQRRLVMRTKHPEDQRATLVTLQPAGRRFAEAVLLRGQWAANHVIEQSGLDANALVRVLRAAADALSHVADNPAAAGPPSATAEGVERGSSPHRIPS